MLVRSQSPVAVRGWRGPFDKDRVIRNVKRKPLFLYCDAFYIRVGTLDTFLHRPPEPFLQWSGILLGRTHHHIEK